MDDPPHLSCSATIECFSYGFEQSKTKNFVVMSACQKPLDKKARYMFRVLNVDSEHLDKSADTDKSQQAEMCQSN